MSQPYRTAGTPKGGVFGYTGKRRGEERAASDQEGLCSQDFLGTGKGVLAQDAKLVA